MDVLLLLNGHDGWQTGIEDGFTSMKNSGIINNLNWFYFETYNKKFGFDRTSNEIIRLCNELNPDIIIFFHIGSFPISKLTLKKIKQIKSNPVLIYDEGDMYGGISKPLNRTIHLMLKEADVISIRGLGSFYSRISKYNKNIIYTPHHADIARYDFKPEILEHRNHKIVLIGNRVKPRFLSYVRRMPGAQGRENFVKFMGEKYPNDFKVFGNGWHGFQGNQGPIDFQKQMEIYKNSWITVAYEHYPNIPYYFSNRLPIALLAGSIYVSHFHEGYDNIFRDQNFIFSFKKFDEAVDIITYINSLSKEEILKRSENAREYAVKNFLPEVVWRNFLSNALKARNA